MQYNSLFTPALSFKYLRDRGLFMVHLFMVLFLRLFCGNSEDFLSFTKVPTSWVATWEPLSCELQANELWVHQTTNQQVGHYVSCKLTSFRFVNQWLFGLGVCKLTVFETASQSYWIQLLYSKEYPKFSWKYLSSGSP